MANNPPATIERGYLWNWVEYRASSSKTIMPSFNLIDVGTLFIRSIPNNPSIRHPIFTLRNSVDNMGRELNTFIRVLPKTWMPDLWKLTGLPVSTRMFWPSSMMIWLLTVLIGQIVNIIILSFLLPNAKFGLFPELCKSLPENLVKSTLDLQKSSQIAIFSLEIWSFQK